MKGKKKSTLQLLIDQVVGDVSKRFPPDVKEIKKRVENLIEREVGDDSFFPPFPLSARRIRSLG
jgi:hypothetical protein